MFEDNKDILFRIFDIIFDELIFEKVIEIN